MAMDTEFRVLLSIVVSADAKLSKQDIEDWIEQDVVFHISVDEKSDVDATIMRIDIDDVLGESEIYDTD